MYCPFCGTQIADSAAFCSACGRQIAQIQQPAAQPVYVPPVQQKAPELKKRSSLFGVFALIVALLFPLCDLFWRVALYRMVTGEPRFMPRVFLGMYNYYLILSFLGIAGMILIAIYYLAMYPKRKGSALAAVGAILIVLSQLSISGNFNVYTIGSVIIIIAVTLLAVYWFSNEKITVLGILGPALIIGATCMTQIVDLLRNGLGMGSVLFWAGTLRDFMYVIFWAIVLIANIVGNKKLA